METNEYANAQPEGAKVDGIRTFKEVAESPAWRELHPNYLSPNALLPKDLTSKHLESLAEVLTDNQIVQATKEKTTTAFYTETVKNIARHAFTKKEIPGLGELERVDNGEAKICWKLTTPNGKTMAVLLRGYDQGLGTTIPEDSKLYQFSRASESDYFEYSDLRTYLVYPLPELENRAMVLQEYGGDPQTKDKISYGRQFISSLQRERAKRKALSYIRSQGFTFTDDTKIELGKQKHYLFTQGIGRSPALIDIPVQKKSNVPFAQRLSEMLPK